ncbi:DMT family transporter [Tichowtungia aerotolerans]|uniref:EamA family transporter n=1 Tax=Tichowtungia aerotolerans TaxID=2697043 RepID=A0A6P1MHB1_9BACT|nr:EamA family transporter [Tichowtungia aerotolerans]QHI70465.1 EamA family transporter [Tichowtungia aerotolerans]
MSGPERSSGIGLTALILGVLLFSTVEVASKLMQIGDGIAGSNPFWLACFRFVITGLVLAAPARSELRRRNVRIGLRDWMVLFGVGLVGVTLMASLFHLGIMFLPANIAALIFSCNPVFVVLFAALMLSEKITLRKLGAVLLCLTGVGALAKDRADGVGLQGILIMAAATLAFALYTVFSKKIIPRYGALTIITLASLIGGVILLPIAFTLEGVPFSEYGAVDWFGTVYLAIFGTAIGYFLYIHGIGHVGAGTGSMAFFLKPFAAAFFAWLILDEKFSTPEILAGIFILAGMITALTPGKSSRAKPQRR